MVNIKAHLNEAIEKATDGTPTLTQTSGEFQCSKGFIIQEIWISMVSFLRKLGKKKNMQCSPYQAVIGKIYRLKQQF